MDAEHRAARITWGVSDDCGIAQRQAPRRARDRSIRSSVAGYARRAGRRRGQTVQDRLAQPSGDHRAPADISRVDERSRLVVTVNDLVIAGSFKILADRSPRRLDETFAVVFEDRLARVERPYPLGGRCLTGFNILETKSVRVSSANDCGRCHKRPEGVLCNCEKFKAFVGWLPLPSRVS